MGVRLENDQGKPCRRYSRLGHLFIILIRKLGLPFLNNIQNNNKKKDFLRVRLKLWFQLEGDGYGIINRETKQRREGRR